MCKLNTIQLSFQLYLFHHLAWYFWQNFLIISLQVSYLSVGDVLWEENTEKCGRKQSGLLA